MAPVSAGNCEISSCDTKEVKGLTHSFSRAERERNDCLGGEKRLAPTGTCLGSRPVCSCKNVRETDKYHSECVDAELQFEPFEDEDVMGPLSRPYGRNRFTKLETIQAREIFHVLRWDHLITVIVLLFTIVSLMLVLTLFSGTYTYKLGESTRTVTVLDLPAWFVTMCAALQIMLLAYACGFAIYYGTTIWRLERSQRIQEQIWVLILLVCVLLYISVTEAVPTLINSQTGTDL